MSNIIESIPTEFDWFGPSLITPKALGEATTMDVPVSELQARKALRSSCPTAPGVYGWLNSDRQLIYVGKSKSLRYRLLSYFGKNPSDPKMLRIRRSAKKLVWEPIAHELLALLREQELIHRWRPEYNSQGQPTRRQPAFVCISNSAAPHAIVAKRLSMNVSKVYGPFMGTGDLTESIEAFNHVFKLRNCPDKTKFEFGAQLLLFEESPRAQCIRFELGSCPAPCAGICSASEYKLNLKQAKQFLDGDDSKTLARLEEEMRAAANRRHFERATVLRNHWMALSRLHTQLMRLRHCESSINGVLTCKLPTGRTLWKIFRAGRLAASLPEPRSEQQALKASSLIETIRSHAVEPTSNILDVNMQLIIGSWFRKHSSQIDLLIPFDATIQNCRQIAARYRKSA